MANQMIGNRAGVAARNANNGQQATNMNGSTGQLTAHWDTDYVDISAMRTRLAAIDAGYYTATRLDAMTMNDMLYAIRLNDTPGTI